MSFISLASRFEWYLEMLSLCCIYLLVLTSLVSEFHIFFTRIDVHVQFRCLYRRRISLADCLPTATEDCLDLVGKLLQFNPDKRLSAQEALTHPYVLRYVVRRL